MFRHQQRASFLFVASMLILACAGCQRGLQGRFVCTQQLSQQHLTGETSTVRPVLDFRRDGTVYLDGVFSGEDHLQATYSVQADQVRFTLLGGLEVHTGTIRGDLIDTDFAQLQMVKVTKTAEGAGVYQPDQKTLGMNYEFIAPGQTYETFEPQLVKLSFKYAGGGTSHGPLLPVAVIVLLLFVVLLVVILLPKLNLHLVGRGTRTYLHHQQTQQPPQPPSVPVLSPPAPPSQSVSVETPRPQAASAPAPPSPSQQHGVLDVHIDPDEAVDGATTPAPLQELAATPPPAPATPPATSADGDDIDVRLWS